MKRKFYSLSVIFLLTLISCSGLRVVNEKSETANLDKYNFYTLADIEQGFLPDVNPTQKKQIESAIDAEIENLSTVQGNTGVTGPDILISYFVIVDTKQDIETYTNYYGRRQWRHQIIDVDIREYKEGTLLLDFIDAKTNEVVWHASTTSTITSNSMQLERKINDAVTALFQQYKKDQVK